MAPKKRSPSSNTTVQGPSQSSQQQQQHHPVEIDPTLEQQTSAVLPSSKAKRRRQPRDSAGITPLQSPTSPALVDPSLSSLPVADSPHQSSEGTVPESASRRQSTSSTMRTSSIPMEGPTTQTPTGRISKAKKGKRVHACQFEGCGKVSQPAHLRSVAACGGVSLCANPLARYSPEQSIDGDMSSTITPKLCSFAIVPAAIKPSTVWIFFSDTRIGSE
jgi:hypothetical protein